MLHAKLAHRDQCSYCTALCPRYLVNGGAVGRVGDGGFLVFQGVLVGEATEFAAELGADGLVIVSSPRVKHGGAGNGHLAGKDGRHGADSFDVARGGFEDDVEPLVSGGSFVVARLKIGDNLSGCSCAKEHGSRAAKCGEVCFQWEFHSEQLLAWIAVWWHAPMDEWTKLLDQCLLSGDE